MAEERELVKRILTGDSRAFTEFVLQYQRLVSHIVFRMVANEADREDLCQDVFLGLYRNLAGFRFQSKMSTWVARVTYFRCLNYLEKKKTPLFEDICGEDQTIADVAGNGELPDEFAVSQDIAGRLREEIDKLPVHYRTVLTLYHLDEMSYQEITKITDLPKGTVKSYLFRARRLLKQRLEAQYGAEGLS